MTQFDTKLTDEMRQYIIDEREKNPPTVYRQLVEDIKEKFNETFDISRLSQIHKSYKKKQIKEEAILSKRSKKGRSRKKTTKEETDENEEYLNYNTPELTNPNIDVSKTFIDLSQMTDSNLDFGGTTTLEDILNKMKIGSKTRDVILAIWSKEPNQNAISLSETLSTCHVPLHLQNVIIAATYGNAATKNIINSTNTEHTGSGSSIKGAVNSVIDERLLSLRKTIQLEDLQSQVDIIQKKKDGGASLKDLLQDIFALEAISRARNKGDNEGSMNPLMQKLLDRQLNDKNNALETIRAFKELEGFSKSSGDDALTKMLMEDRKRSEERLERIESTMKDQMRSLEEKNIELKLEKLEHEYNSRLAGTVTEDQAINNLKYRFQEMKQLGLIPDNSGTTKADAALRRVQVLEKAADTWPDKVVVGIEKLNHTVDRQFDKLGTLLMDMLDRSERQQIRQTTTQDQLPIPHSQTPRTPEERIQMLDQVNAGIENVEFAKDIMKEIRELKN